jgi:hypothetical protein
MLDIILALRVLYLYNRTATYLVFRAYEADLVAKGKLNELYAFRRKIHDFRRRSVNEFNIHFNDRQFWYFAHYFLVPKSNINIAKILPIIKLELFYINNRSNFFGSRTKYNGNSDIITFSIEAGGETITFERDAN